MTDVKTRPRLAAERAWMRCESHRARVRAVLAYPSPYRVGMSSLGFQQVYRLWNSDPRACCDRAFLPEPGRRAAGPLVGLETGLPLGGFHLVGISLAWELELGGVARVLELGGLDPLAAHRGPADPPVVVGGPLTFSNPLPAWPLADVLVLGEAEPVAPALLQARLATADKAEFLDAARGLPGVVVPTLDGEAPVPLARADEADLPARSAIVTPDTELSGMFLVEAARGCHRRCTYCVMRRPDPGEPLLAGGGLRPVPAERVLAALPDDAARVGLVGAAVTDHPDLRELLRTLADDGREVGVSSLRADRLDDELVGLLRRGGLRTLTTAADGASERLRESVRRGTRERHLLRAAELVAAHELRELKLYAMLGLPGEADEDVEELVDLSLRLRAIARVSLSVSPFVPKRNTPLSGAPYAGIRTVEQRLSRLRKALRGRVLLRPTSARWAWVEARLAAGGPEAGLAALEAVRGGGSFGDWRRALGS